MSLADKEFWLLWVRAHKQLVCCAENGTWYIDVWESFAGSITLQNQIQTDNWSLEGALISERPTSPSIQKKKRENINTLFASDR